MIAALKKRFSQSSQRSQEAIRNIVISMAAKCITVIATLLLVPLTIQYVNATQYGIWLTLSSIIAWVYFFDMGLGNGFRNRYAEAKAANNMILARQYVSTTYFAIALIVGVVFVLLMILNAYVDWTSILKVDALYHDELRNVFCIVCGFFCLSMVANIFAMLLTADQKPGWAAMLNGLGNLGSLLVIFVLTKVSSGSLTNLALYYSGVPCIVMLIGSIIMFCGRYRNVSPRLRDIRVGLVRDIMGLGLQFFVIYLCMIVLFQIINVVISREIGPYAVTQYNVAHKYFNVLHMLMIIVITPFWSAFTDAYYKRDYGWMRTSLRKLELSWLCAVLGGIVMLLLAPYFYAIWVGESVQLPWQLSLITMMYVLFQTLGGVYMYPINGIGKICVQLIAYLVLALIAWPTMIWGARNWGLVGVLILPSVAFLVQAILGKIQLTKLLSGVQTGIWCK